jgi:hypothetical protein
VIFFAIELAPVVGRARPGSGFVVRI